MMALIAVYLACFKDHSASMSPGEVPTIEQITADSVTLTNGVVIEIHAASFRSVRGYSLLAAICDEVSFWRSDESANPDVEIISALRPGLMTVRGSLLLAISSPYSQRGILWDMYKKHRGKDGPVLVWKAGTSEMNPTVDPDLIAEAYESDPARAAAEFRAEFRSDLQGLVDRAVVEDAVIPGRHELPWVPHTVYKAFCDPSGGSSDSFTLAISHQEGDRIVLDALERGGRHLALIR